MSGTARLLGWAGVGLGLLAAWVALPPLELRTFVAPLLLGAAGASVGVLAVRSGDPRRGRFALAAGALGGGLGILATHSSTAHLEVVVGWAALLAAMLRGATPLLFAAIGGMVCERSGDRKSVV